MFSPSRPEQMEPLESGTERAFSAPVKWTRVSDKGHAPLFYRGLSDQYNTASSERRGYCSAQLNVITALGGMVQTAKRASTRTSFLTRPYELETRVWQLAQKQKARLELPREAGAPSQSPEPHFTTSGTGRLKLQVCLCCFVSGFFLKSEIVNVPGRRVFRSSLGGAKHFIQASEQPL